MTGQKKTAQPGEMERLSTALPAPANCKPVAAIIASMSKQPKKPTKEERVLGAFLNGEKLHRFSAFRLRDTCLNSTVSDLVNRHGLAIDRQRIALDRQGDQVSVMLYWLAPGSAEDAERLLDEMKARRGAIDGG